MSTCKYAKKKKKKNMWAHMQINLTGARIFMPIIKVFHQPLYLHNNGDTIYFE